MKKIYRNTNIINNKQDLIYLFTFKKFPIYQNCTESKFKEDKFFDMNWYISKSTGIIQLNPLIPLSVLYKDQHASSVGNTWKEYHLSFAKFISKYVKKSVFEIGGSYGFLAKIFLKNKKIKWTIVDPNPVIKDKKIKVINGFFDKKIKINKNVDVVVHSHVLEHLYDPIKFLKIISKKINDNTFHCFSIPNLKFWLENKYTNTLDFEHTLYLSEEIIDRLLFISNFKIIDKKFYKNHSIFYTTIKQKNNENKFFNNSYDVNKKVYLDFILYHKKLVKIFNWRIQSHKGEIFLFGAHIFSQFLISFGLNTGKISAILDNDNLKHDKRLYGTNLNVYLPKIIAKKKNIVVILRAGAYNNEICYGLNKINKSVQIWD